MQYSVFRERVTANDKTLILNEIEEIVGNGDKMHIIDLCARHVGRILRLLAMCLLCRSI